MWGHGFGWLSILATSAEVREDTLLILSCRRLWELACLCDMAATVKGEMPRWQISKDRSLLNPNRKSLMSRMRLAETKMWTGDSALGRGAKASWRIHGLDAWQGSPFLHHQVIDGWALVHRLEE
jgi:hypothetical protein